MKRTLAAAVTASALMISSLAAASPALAAPPEGASVAPSVLLSELRVATPSPVTYNRDLFAEGIDADGDGCNTRREVLQAESLVPVTIVAGCTITAGEWYSWYDGVTWTDPAQLEMDHLVALKEAWHAGAHAWTNQQRSDYANDLGIDATLTVVTGSVNGAKSHFDPTTWVPSVESARCTYASDWITVKYRWNLSVDTAEKSGTSVTDLDLLRRRDHRRPAGAQRHPHARSDAGRRRESAAGWDAPSRRRRPVCDRGQDLIALQTGCARGLHRHWVELP